MRGSDVSDYKDCRRSHSGGGRCFAGAETGWLVEVSAAAGRFRGMRGVFLTATVREWLRAGRPLPKQGPAAAAKETVVGVGGLAEEAATSRWVNCSIGRKRTSWRERFITEMERRYTRGHRYPGLPGKTIFHGGGGTDKIMDHCIHVANRSEGARISSKQTSRVSPCGKGVRI